MPIVKTPASGGSAGPDATATSSAAPTISSTTTTATCPVPATSASSAASAANASALATATSSSAAAAAAAISGGAESDGDDDMSGDGESQRSGGSSRCGAERERDSSGEDDDSDDSSEMDESECERRRNDCIDNLANLERQFGILREQLYCERINQVDNQLSEIRAGRSQEYLGPLQDLNENLRTRTEVASVLRSMQTDNIQHKFDSEELAALQHYESEKRLAMDHIYDDLMEKVRRLEEDRHNVDISWADWGTSTRTSKVRGPGKKKAVTVTGPYIVYMLADEDILEDWKIIRKALKRTTSVAAASVGIATSVGGGGGPPGS